MPYFIKLIGFSLSTSLHLSLSLPSPLLMLVLLLLYETPACWYQSWSVWVFFFLFVFFLCVCVFPTAQNSIVAGEVSLEFHNTGKAESETGLKQYVWKRLRHAIGNCIAEHQSRGQSLLPIGWVSPVTHNVIIFKCSLLCKSRSEILKPRHLPTYKSGVLA